MSGFVAHARTCRQGVARALPRVAGVVLASALIAVAVGGNASSAAAPKPYERAPNQVEISLLALANKERAKAGTHPLVWHDGLGMAAREHTYDMIEHDCFQHDSCNGELWWRRIARHYPFWSTLGENVTGGGEAQGMHDNWMASSGHRANIMSPSYAEFGAGAYFDASQGNATMGTENFGTQGGVNLSAIPTIPAATVLPPPATARPYNGTWNWELLVNYYDRNAGPKKVEAVVDGQRKTLTLVGGTQKNGSWGGTQPAQYPVDCKHVYYEVTRADDTKVRYPTTGAFAFGTWPTCWDQWAPLDFANPPPATTTTVGATTTTTKAPTTTTTKAPTTTTTTTTPTQGAPVVVIDNPAPGAITGNVEIRAHATDPDGVVQMEVYVNDKRLVRVGTDSVKRKWESGKLPSGSYKIEVKAKDGKGLIGTKTITVTK